MRNLFHLRNDSLPSSFETALSLLAEGQAVMCPGFTIQVIDRVVRIGVDYYEMQPDEGTAQRLIDRARTNFEALLETHPNYHAKLSGLPRRITLVHWYGMGEIEVATVDDNSITWLV